MFKSILLSAVMITSVFAVDEEFESKKRDLQAMVIYNLNKIELRLTQDLIPCVKRNYAGEPDRIESLSKQYFDELYLEASSYQFKVINAWKDKGLINDKLWIALRNIGCLVPPRYQWVNGECIRVNRENNLN